MNHWETAGRMAAEHHADLDREAVRARMAALVKAGHPSSRPPLQSVVAGWFQRLRTSQGSTGYAGQPLSEVPDLQAEI
jgi:hypothetical protein